MGTYDEVACSMYSEKASCKITLHYVLKIENVGILVDQIGDVAIGSRSGCCNSGDVTTEASRVGAETVWCWVQGYVIECRSDWTESDGHVSERTSGNAATTGTWRQNNQRCCHAGNTNAAVVVVCTIVAHRCGRTVENGSSQRIRGNLAPIEVGLVSGVAALIAQGLLICPGEIPVPREKVTSTMNRQGLVDVL